MRPSWTTPTATGSRHTAGSDLASVVAGRNPAAMTTLRLKWLHQAQFAGYYLAEDKGFYRAEGLDVDIRPGGADVDPESLVASGEADFAQAGGLESVLAARDAGWPVVAIGAAFQRIDVAFIARKEAGGAPVSGFTRHG